MNTHGPQQEINYRMPGATEKHLHLYASREAALAAKRRQERQAHLSEASIFYFKAVLLLGTLIMAYMVFSPHI